MIDWKDLLHRYVEHVGDEEGTCFIPMEGIDIQFSREEIQALEEMERTKPEWPIAIG